MRATPVNAGLRLDGLKALSLLRALGSSPLLIIGVSLLFALSAPYVIETLHHPALGGHRAAVAAGLLGTGIAYSLILRLRQVALSDRLGPLGPALSDPRQSHRLMMARWGLVMTSPAIGVAVIALLVQPELALTMAASLICGAIAGLGLGCLWPVAVTPSKPVRAKAHPISSSGFNGLLVIATGFAALSVLLHRQGLEDQAHLPRLIALAVLIFSQIDSPHRLLALLASRPAHLICTVGPLGLKPLVVAGLGGTLVLSLTGSSPVAAMVTGLGLGLLAALLRLLIALSRLGHSAAMAHRLTGLELLLPLFIAITGQWPLVPLWLVIRLIWLWHRAEKMRFREVIG